MTFFSLEQHIATHKPFRFIDAFVAEQPPQFNGISWNVVTIKYIA